MNTILIVLLILLLLGAFGGGWAHANNQPWGAPLSGLLGLVLAALIILWLLGQL